MINRRVCVCVCVCVCVSTYVSVCIFSAQRSDPSDCVCGKGVCLLVKEPEPGICVQLCHQVLVGAAGAAQPVHTRQPAVGSSPGQGVSSDGSVALLWA